MTMKFKERSPKSKMILALSFVASIGITPFIVFRILNQEWSIALIDLMIVFSMFYIFAIVYISDNIKKASLIVIAIILLGNILPFYIKGIKTLYWIYPSILATYYLVNPKTALSVSAIMLAFFLPKLISDLEAVHMATIVITIGITNIIAYVFSSGLREREQALKKLASEDYLTATGNRRSLQYSIQNLEKALNKNIETATIILLDLDDFKKVNDAYGHLKGDEVLVDLSKLLFAYFKNTDSIFRYGGEEFLVICVDSTAQQAFDMAEEFRVKVKENIVINQNPQTISLGVAEYIKKETLEDWIHRVDVALYQAKNQGKDRAIKA